MDIRVLYWASCRDETEASLVEETKPVQNKEDKMSSDSPSKPRRKRKRTDRTGWKK